ncbi:biotin--[acetyl-CoA-carboxylase] ligase [Gaetbulibacter sp. PBL-D1]|uniref:biotin--[acetyl-CoA-carboxylase] ligase n=1 Tax=Gaetbulibacter sp. PBL-D1 TaxID=3422594 RepID=UPI003D2EC5A1
MHIIKLNAIDSTNTYLRQLSASKAIEDFTVVVAKHQTKGRGQMGTQWNVQDAKNLTMSVFKDITGVDVERNFYISIAVSLAVFEALKSLNVEKLSIKWPNDILSENKKIAGILIENVIKQNRLQASIIGIGINVNQTEFENLPKASSLQLMSGRFFELDEIMITVLQKLEYFFELLQKNSFSTLKSQYEEHLFRKNKPSTFKDMEGNMFSGYIKGVSNSGNLQVLLEDEIIKEFDLKEITLLY